MLVAIAHPKFEDFKQRKPTKQMFLSHDSLAFSRLLVRFSTTSILLYSASFKSLGIMQCLLTGEQYARLQDEG